MRSTLFWDFTQHRVVYLYRHFGTTYLSHLQGSRRRIHFSWTSWPLKIALINCPETSTWNYHSILCKIPEDCRSQLHHGGSPKSRKINLVLMNGVAPWWWWWWLNAKTCRSGLILYIYIFGCASCWFYQMNWNHVLYWCACANDLAQGMNKLSDWVHVL